MKQLEGMKPKPRLEHIQPGQFFTLTANDGGHTYKMLSRCKTYCYHSTGKIALSTEISPVGLVFGNGGGWRVKPDES
ncbi:hypothetical protein [Paenalcaligenes suwonensis]|uniref:hypothetical protein n=1 Tax=Paenalcaligenes suwonensis TaxID=1202713 RepID=UPI00140CFF7E|nr:hypothetical protein [Paenalcaligenes suwonensis]NHC62744.1 hypothetical protein [Paenalcaligenes suwonensis]